ncbi:DUF4179 domain-containing protein [Paenibacillus tuaregi]|uniref:DUF4179 domain-containing protein n=1 Tax=Paenibacillus tuaregi TaxID=1816681 RepID=UPI0008391483|nr:DUF4179 domain-containing protein [Paenibacillus tuaregi]
MADQEEKMLRDYFQEARIAEQHVSAFNLNDAVNRGIERANLARQKKVYFRRFGSVAGTLAFCLMIVLIFRIGHSGTVPAANIQFTAPDYVTAAIQGNPVWLTAANHGLYQPMSQTVEKDGYKLTVDGVLADNLQAIVFYRTENVADAEPIKLRFFNVKGKYTIQSIPYNNSVPTEQVNAQKQGFLALNFLGLNTPGSFNFESSWSKGSSTDTQTLSLPIVLDTTKFRSLVRTADFNQFVSIHNHGFQVKRANLYPLSTEITIDYDADNNNIIRFISPSLMLKSTHETSDIKYLYHLVNNKGPYRVYFDSIYYDQFLQLTFAAKGIEESLGNDLNIVINTSEQKLIWAPDERLHLNRITQTGEVTEISLSFSAKNRPSQEQTPLLISDFMDANRELHKLVTNPASATELPTGYISVRTQAQDEQVYPVYIQTGKYAEPLTFRLSQYPGNDYLQSFSVTGQ